MSLKDLPTGNTISITAIIDLMKVIYSSSTYVDKTWRSYGIRLSRWRNNWIFTTYQNLKLGYIKTLGQREIWKI